MQFAVAPEKIFSRRVYNTIQTYQINQINTCTYNTSSCKLTHILTHQQFSMALAIPARAWTNPGPDTTRQTDGLQLLYTWTSTAEGQQAEIV